MPSQGTSTAALTSSAPPPQPTSTPSAPALAIANPELDALLTRLTSHRAVRGVLILSRDGPIIRHSGAMFEGEEGRTYARVVGRVVRVVREGIAEVGEGDDLKFLRVRTKRHELMITPNERYVLVVLQDPTT